MRRLLHTLTDEETLRNADEYLGAFTESVKMTLHQNPVERMANAVYLAAKTALRLKATSPNLKEHEIAGRLQSIAHQIRLASILKELTPEEKRMMKLNRLVPEEFMPPSKNGSASPLPKRPASNKRA